MSRFCQQNHEQMQQGSETHGKISNFLSLDALTVEELFLLSNEFSC
jgi:hypothetical protein